MSGIYFTIGGLDKREWETIHNFCRAQACMLQALENSPDWSHMAKVACANIEELQTEMQEYEKGLEELAESNRPNYEDI